MGIEQCPTGERGANLIVTAIRNLKIKKIKYRIVYPIRFFLNTGNGNLMHEYYYTGRE